MKKLKIVDDVDLKELEKFGFKEINYVNMIIYKFENDYGNIIIGLDKIIHLNHFTTNNTALLDVIYNLTKANLTKVVENES